MKRVMVFVLSITVGLVASNAFAQGAKTQDGSARRGAPAAAKAQTTPVALKDGVAVLSPANTKVEFVGTHTGNDPKPRLGGFKKFTGVVAMNEDGKSIKSIGFDFETGSLWTELGGALTTHLKGSDYLNVEAHPTAKFASTKISAGESEGMVKVVGDFTLMGKTNEITIPMTMSNGDAGVLLKGELKLDRTEFGMNGSTDKVSKEVSITVSVGEKTASGGGGGGAQRGGGRGGRRRDPAAMFKQMDANGDGKLEGDEIPERMRQFAGNMDTDKDGAITEEELKTAFESFGGRGGGKGKGGGGRKSRPKSDGGR